MSFIIKILNIKEVVVTQNLFITYLTRLSNIETLLLRYSMLLEVTSLKFTEENIAVIIPNTQLTAKISQPIPHDPKMQ